MNKKQKRILTILVLMSSILAVVIVSVVPWQLVHDNGGGGEEPDFYNTLPTYPILNDIQPDPDTDGEITLDWSDSSWLWYYNVYRGKSDLVEVKIATGILCSSFTDCTTKDDGVYYYKIEAVNNIGRVQSNVQDVTVEISEEEEEEEEEEPIDPVVPNEPVLETIESPNIDGEISLEWDVVPNAWYYEIHRSKDGDDYEQIFPNPETNYFDDSVYVDGTYSYKVKAGNDDGISDFSNVEAVVVCFLEEEEDEEVPEEPIEPSDDNTTLYILLGVLAVLIVPVVILVKRKSKKP